MFSRDCLERKIDSLLCRQMINAFRGCGKTRSVYELALKDIDEGKKVCIVTNHTYLMKLETKFKELIEQKKLDIVHMDTVIKELINARKYTEEHPDIGCLFIKQLPEFKVYDYILIDTAIYEDVIISLMEKLDKITMEAKKWH